MSSPYLAIMRQPEYSRLVYSAVLRVFENWVARRTQVASRARRAHNPGVLWFGGSLPNPNPATDEGP
jgi:hypothetical protein